ncbi:unnamed protein product [Oikopleura dioica]|uniref:Tetraspanin n=1 Tax=Oikopleura dioica TaxID=34765 RepID=E4XN22_OIKDI|nr:unnamed protein product [Oikopleura dioica]
MREVEFDQNLTKLLNSKFQPNSRKNSRDKEKNIPDEELDLSFEEPTELDAQHEFDETIQPKNTASADDFVPIDETYTENGRHTVLENKLQLVDIKKKGSKKSGGKQDVQISLGRGNLIDPRDQKGKSFRELINGINDQQPLGQADIERMILEKGKQTKEQEPDAYKDTFLPGQQEPAEEVFNDPMVAAYSALTKRDVESEESDLTEAIVTRKLEKAPEPERLSKNEKVADFSYPSVALGKRGLKPQKKFDVETLEKKNILSLMDPNEIVEQFIPKGEETSDELEEKNSEPPKKSKLGPIILPEAIGLERCKITGPGGKKELIKEEIKNVDIVQIKAAPKEDPPKTEEIIEDKEKLERLEKAKGQGEPSEIVLQNPELSILEERKKKRIPKEESPNPTKEKVTKNSKDETLIEITAPGAIPNFGKKSKPDVEKQNFESVFISTDTGQPVDAMINTLNSLGVLGSKSLEINASAPAGVIDPDVNLNEQLGKIGVEGDPNDLEIFPLATGPIADIEIHRTDHLGNTEVKVETLKREENQRDFNQLHLDDYEDEATSIEKSSKMDAPDVIKGEDSGETGEKSQEEQDDIAALPAISPRNFGKPLIPVENISAWEDPDKSIHVDVPNEIEIDDPLEQELEERDDLGLPIEDKRQTIERIHQSHENPVLICSDPAFFCLCLGLLVVLVSINGALGFLRCHLLILNFFAWMLILLFLAFFGAGIAFWILSAKVMRIFKYASLAAVFHYNHHGGTKPTRWALSRMVDFTQSRLQCCGSSGLEDWTQSAIVCVPKNPASDLDFLPAMPQFEPQRQLPSNPFDAFKPIPKKPVPTAAEPSKPAATPLVPELFPSQSTTPQTDKVSSTTKPIELAFTRPTVRQTLYMRPTSNPIMIKPSTEKDEVDKIEEENLRTRFQPDKCRIPESCCAGGGLGGGYCGTNVIEKPYLTGCYHQIGNFIEKKSAAIAAIWISLWALMLLQIMSARFLIRRIRLERKFIKAYNKARNDFAQKQAYFEEEKELRSSREMTLARNYPIQLAPLQKCPSEGLKDEQNEDNFDDERTIPVHPSQFPSINDVSRLVSQREEPKPQSILKKTFQEPDSEDEVGIDYNLRPLE